LAANLTGDVLNGHRYDHEFETYARGSRARLHRVAYRMCGDWHQAEDLTQLTLQKVYEQWDRLTQHDQLNAYSHKVLLRVYLSEHRRLRWSREVLTRVNVPEPAAWDDPADDRVTLLAAVNRLGRSQRRIIMLRFWLDCSVEQTARLLDCSVGTVTGQTTRALRTLRNSLS
jgi:RNA polymerase sigma-70 factor (sigma-E family)